MSTRKTILTGLVLAFALTGMLNGLTHLSELGQQAPPTSPAAGAKPAWVDAHFAAHVGTWVADNTAFRSEAEPFDAYAIDWNWGIGRQSLVGRLYAMAAGRDVGTHWELREFWHPGERRLVAAQFGADGRYGVGPHLRRPDGSMDMVQTFYDAAGRVTRNGHESLREGDVLITRSFDVAADGTRTPRRTYTWKRKQRAGLATLRERHQP